GNLLADAVGRRARHALAASNEEVKCLTQAVGRFETEAIVAGGQGDRLLRGHGEARSGLFVVLFVEHLGGEGRSLAAEADVTKARADVPAPRQDGGHREGSAGQGHADDLALPSEPAASALRQAGPART